MLIADNDINQKNKAKHTVLYQNFFSCVRSIHSVLVPEKYIFQEKLSPLFNTLHSMSCEAALFSSFASLGGACCILLGDNILSRNNPWQQAALILTFGSLCGAFFGALLGLLKFVIDGKEPMNCVLTKIKWGFLSITILSLPLLPLLLDNYRSVKLYKREYCVNNFASEALGLVIFAALIGLSYLAKQASQHLKFPQSSDVCCYNHIVRSGKYIFDRISGLLELIDSTQQGVNVYAGYSAQWLALTTLIGSSIFRLGSDSPLQAATMMMSFGNLTGGCVGAVIGAREFFTGKENQTELASSLLTALVMVFVCLSTPFIPKYVYTFSDFDTYDLKRCTDNLKCELLGDAVCVSFLTVSFFAEKYHSPVNNQETLLNSFLLDNNINSEHSDSNNINMSMP